SIANHRGSRSNSPCRRHLETQQQTTRASSALVSFRRHSNDVFIAFIASSCCNGRGRTRQHRFPTRRAAWVACLLDDLDCRRRRLIPCPTTASCTNVQRTGNRPFEDPSVGFGLSKRAKRHKSLLHCKLGLSIPAASRRDIATTSPQPHLGQ
ncbi:hypothetical protein N431DRAFT_518802, partial [Stipitochalara longipes BDJ]